jgi:phosphoribosylcarboxyaminoimidazole (NCAIR) mutase
MSKSIPVATVAIGNAENAGLLAVRMLASRDPELGDKYDFFFFCNSPANFEVCLG